MKYKTGHPYYAHKTKWTVKDLKTGRITRHDTQESARAEAFYIADNYGHCPSIAGPIN